MMHSEGVAKEGIVILAVSKADRSIDVYTPVLRPARPTKEEQPWCRIWRVDSVLPRIAGLPSGSA